MSRFGMELTGMGPVTWTVKSLLVILRENRDNHHATFEAAIVKFREQAVGGLDRLVADIKAGKLPSYVGLNLPIPEEHTDDYDRVIDMLERHQRDTFELTEEAYVHLVADDWGWKQSFASNTMAYLSTDDSA